MAASATSRLTLLGTQGWIPSPGRHTTSVAFQTGSVLLLFDAGTGLSRLLKPPLAEVVEQATEIHLFLSHYHLDHSCGLAYLTGLLGDRALTVHVPGLEVNGVDPQNGVPALLRRPFHPVAWEDQAGYVLQPLAAGVNEVAGVSVQVRAQCHADISVAYRVGDLFVFATDTVADPATSEFARGARLLLHEAWIDGAEERDPSHEALVRKTYASHTSARQAATIAADAAVEDLFLIHLTPLFNEAYYRGMQRSARTIFPATLVPTDLHVHDFSG